MKIIVGGAGSVGQSILDFLVRGNNDITIIDNDSRTLNEVSQKYDILPVLGSVSHPDVLEKAGTAKADLLIAATDGDEVNLVACQVAHSEFQVRSAIARIGSRSFLNPLWNTLFGDHAIPVDLIISPDIAIAEDIMRLLKFPGALQAYPFFEKKLYLIGVKIEVNCPLLNTELKNVSRVAPTLEASIVNIIRRGKSFVPGLEDSFELGDEVYFLAMSEQILEAVREFGQERPGIERVVIFGGNDIALALARQLEKDDNIVSCKIVVEDYKEAKALATELNTASVINGPMMSDDILREAGIDNADAAIAVTEQDKDNLLVSLLSGQAGVKTNISLVNTPSYNNLVDNVGDSILVDRSSVTVSGILKEIRKTSMIRAYSLNRGLAEIWEIRLDEDTVGEGMSPAELKLPEGCRICACLRDEEISFPDEKQRLVPGDVIVLYLDSKAVKRIERIFA